MNTLKKNETSAEPAYVSTYRNRTTGSWELFDSAQKIIPGGISHFPRWHDPYPLYCEKAQGSRMWDRERKMCHPE